MKRSTYFVNIYLNKYYVARMCYPNLNRVNIYWIIDTYSMHQVLKEIKRHRLPLNSLSP